MKKIDVTEVDSRMVASGVWSGGGREIGRHCSKVNTVRQEKWVQRSTLQYNDYS